MATSFGETRAVIGCVHSKRAPGSKWTHCTHARRSCAHFGHLLRDMICASTNVPQRAQRPTIGIPACWDSWRPRMRSGARPQARLAHVQGAAAPVPDRRSAADAVHGRRLDSRAACICDRSCVAGADPRSRVPLVHGWERTQPTGCAQRLQPKRSRKGGRIRRRRVEVPTMAKKKGKPAAAKKVTARKVKVRDLAFGKHGVSGGGIWAGASGRIQRQETDLNLRHRRCLLSVWCDPPSSSAWREATGTRRSSIPCSGRASF